MYSIDENIWQEGAGYPRYECFAEEVGAQG